MLGRQLLELVGQCTVAVVPVGIAGVADTVVADIVERLGQQDCVGLG